METHNRVGDRITVYANPRVSTNEAGPRELENDFLDAVDPACEIHRISFRF